MAKRGGWGGGDQRKNISDDEPDMGGRLSVNINI